MSSLLAYGNNSSFVWEIAPLPFCRMSLSFARNSRLRTTFHADFQQNFLLFHVVCFFYNAEELQGLRLALFCVFML